uniref:TM2 domain-containing protein 3 n=2 Tax=Canis lupus familiaris TaxID=9615 RepID=A0A8C0LYR1_CANLF
MEREVMPWGTVGTRTTSTAAARSGRARRRRTHAEPPAPAPAPAPAPSGSPGTRPHPPLRRAPAPLPLLAPPLCLAPPQARKWRAPATWRPRRFRCGPCAAYAACCCSSPSSTSCPAGDQDFKSQKNFIINMTCRFCWQLPETDYECSNSTSCMTVSCPRQRYTANCTVRDHIHCLGNRTFPKMLYCNWTGGYKWSTALALSITLGGFGADRFYLGQWREGLGKLFSFGGLGIWTLIDVLLIGVGYVGPADGSLYI